MKILINKKFLKDLSKLPASLQADVEKLVFDTIPKIDNFNGLGIFEKMKGYKIYYRARMGDYRIGVSYDKDTLVFERVLHRKEIYRIFPWPKSFTYAFSKHTLNSFKSTFNNHILF